MERLLTYGLYNGALHHVHTVANGLACGCTCAHCRQPLIAKNGLLNIKVAHFAHQSGKECAGAYETALHLLAKQVLLHNKRLTLPPFHSDYNPSNKNSIFRQSTVIQFDEVVLEKKSGAGNAFLVPDAIGIIKEKEIYIEFANTHFVDRSKKAKLIRWNKPCIEMSISRLPLDEKALQAFFDAPHHKHKYWVYNPKLDAAYKKAQTAQLQQKQLHKQEKAAAAIQLATNRLQQYQNINGYKALKADAGGTIECPNKWNNLQPLKTTAFYAHPVLQQIIDGAEWDQQVYGHYACGKWIFLNGKQITVFPPDAAWHNNSVAIKQQYRLLYTGLQKIKELLQCHIFINCSHCPYAVDDIALPHAYYKICRFPLQKA